MNSWKNRVHRVWRWAERIHFGPAVPCALQVALLALVVAAVLHSPALVVYVVSLASRSLHRGKKGLPPMSPHPWNKNPSQTSPSSSPLQLTPHIPTSTQTTPCHRTSDSCSKECLHSPMVKRATPDQAATKAASSSPPPSTPTSRRVLTPPAAPLVACAAHPPSSPPPLSLASLAPMLGFTFLLGVVAVDLVLDLTSEAGR